MQTPEFPSGDGLYYQYAEGNAGGFVPTALSRLLLGSPGFIGMGEDQNVYDYALARHRARQFDLLQKQAFQQNNLLNRISFMSGDTAGIAGSILGSPNSPLWKFISPMTGGNIQQQQMGLYANMTGASMQSFGSSYFNSPFTFNQTQEQFKGFQNQFFKTYEDDSYRRKMDSIGIIGTRIDRELGVKGGIFGGSIDSTRLDSAINYLTGSNLSPDRQLKARMEALNLDKAKSLSVFSADDTVTDIRRRISDMEGKTGNRDMFVLDKQTQQTLGVDIAKGFNELQTHMQTTKQGGKSIYTGYDEGDTINLKDVFNRAQINKDEEGTRLLKNISDKLNDFVKNADINSPELQNLRKNLAASGINVDLADADIGQLLDPAKAKEIRDQRTRQENSKRLYQDFSVTKGFNLEDFTSAFTASSHLRLLGTDQNMTAETAENFVRTAGGAMSALRSVFGKSQSGQSLMYQLNDLLGTASVDLTKVADQSQVETMLRNMKVVTGLAGTSIETLLGFIKGASSLYESHPELRNVSGMTRANLATTAFSKQNMLNFVLPQESVRAQGGLMGIQQQEQTQQQTILDGNVQLKFANAQFQMQSPEQRKALMDQLSNVNLGKPDQAMKVLAAARGVGLNANEISGGAMSSDIQRRGGATMESSVLTQRLVQDQYGLESIRSQLPGMFREGELSTLEGMTDRSQIESMLYKITSRQARWSPGQQATVVNALLPQVNSRIRGEMTDMQRKAEQQQKIVQRYEDFGGQVYNPAAQIWQNVENAYTQEGVGGQLETAMRSVNSLLRGTFGVENSNVMQDVQQRVNTLSSLNWESDSKGRAMGVNLQDLQNVVNEGNTSIPIHTKGDFVSLLQGMNNGNIRKYFGMSKQDALQMVQNMDEGTFRRKIVGSMSQGLIKQGAATQGYLQSTELHDLWGNVQGDDNQVIQRLRQGQRSGEQAISSSELGKDLLSLNSQYRSTGQVDIDERNKIADELRATLRNRGFSNDEIEQQVNKLQSASGLFTAQQEAQINKATSEYSVKVGDESGKHDGLIQMIVGKVDKSEMADAIRRIAQSLADILNSK